MGRFGYHRATFWILSRGEHRNVQWYLSSRSSSVSFFASSIAGGTQVASYSVLLWLYSILVLLPFKFKFCVTELFATDNATGPTGVATIQAECTPSSLFSDGVAQRAVRPAVRSPRVASYCAVAAGRAAVGTDSVHRAPACASLRL